MRFWKFANLLYNYRMRFWNELIDWFFQLNDFILKEN